MKCQFSKIILIIACTMNLVIAQPRDGAYQLDFQQVEPGSLPQDIKVLSGEFVVREEATNRYLELVPAPLNSFGLLLGPESRSLRARVRSWTTGRRFPEFGIGLGGVGGYKLWLMPAIGELQIRQSDKILSRIPFQWKSGAWVLLNLNVAQPTQGRWLVAGKAWMEGEYEPADWTIRYEPTEQPPAGRASLWGTPYSEKPIQFDDVIAEAR